MYYRFTKKGTVIPVKMPIIILLKNLKILLKSPEYNIKNIEANAAMSKARGFMARASANPATNISTES